MRIYIISRGYPTEKYVTHGIFEYDQAKALAMYGHEIIYIALDMRSIRRKRKMGRESLIQDGVNIESINLPCGKMPSFFLHAIRKIALSYVYNECLKKYGEPDIIHAHFLEYAFTTAQTLKHCGVPLVMTEHLSALNAKNVALPILKMGKRTYKDFDAVIAVGNNLQSVIKENFGINSVVIPNIVDVSCFTKKYEEECDNRFRIVSVGSLIKRKRMDILIKAFKRFHDKNANTTLQIFGGGEEFNALQELIIKLSLSDCVMLEGPKHRKNIAEAMSKASCFALASATETFGVVYIEAMAAGLPVIATRSNGPEDFVDNECGILVSPDSVEEMAEAMDKLYHSITEFDSHHIRETILARFSPDVISQKLTELYTAVIQGREEI